MSGGGIDPLLLWLDLETEGLSPSEDYILEVAWCLTTHDLSYITEINSAVIDNPCQLHRWSEVVKEMHTKSGLLKDLEADKGQRELYDVESQIIADIMGARLKYGEVPIQLAGASVHFDRTFIKVDMPYLDQILHYRVFDISTLKLFFEPLGIEHQVFNPNQHRAEHDIKESLTVAQRYQGVVTRLLVGLPVAVSSTATSPNP